MSLLAVTQVTRAGTFTNNFNTGTTAPAGTTLNGNSVIEATGGVDSSGVLKITKSLNSQSGSFVIDDLDAGAPVYGFDLSAKVRLGGGTSTPADGFSINFDPTASQTTTTGEEGTAGGITFAFDLYVNDAENAPAPSIDVKVNGATIATHQMTIPEFDTGAGYVDLRIILGADGGVSLAWKGNVLFTNLYYENYQAFTGASFVIGGRTGGANENQWIDNLGITTFTQPRVGIAQQPVSQTVLAGENPVLSVVANNADTASYQWSKNGTAIGGAIQSTYMLQNVGVADSGTKYQVTIVGPNNTVTSDQITLNVREIPVPSTPTLSFNFNDGQTPANATLVGTAIVAGNGGVADSPVLQLTVDAPDQAGALVVSDPAAGAPVYGFTAQFDVLVRSAATPADGFSFSFASDIPDDPTVAPPKGLEDGTGTGLTIGFDTYNNGNGEAPSIDVIYKNQTIASAKVPLSFITTGNEYEPVLIRLENDGTLDVAFKGRVLHDNVPLPGFTSISGGRFALAGRTGGSSADQWVDNLKITPVATAGEVRIATQPASQFVLTGRTATFTAAANDPAGVTFQWFKNGVAIAGATSSSYTTPAAVTADNGAKFKVTATKGALTATSDEATLTVINLADAQVSYDFNNGQLPAGTQAIGDGTDADGNPFKPFVDTTGGVNDSGVLKLMIGVNSLHGTFLIPTLLGGAEITGFTAAFDARIGGGTDTPADGFSFNFAPDLPATAAGDVEDGVGTGLSINFDIYKNDTEASPSIAVKYKGVVVASTDLPFAEIRTGDAYRTVIVRVSGEGKLDLVFGSRILQSGLQLPNYAPVSNGKFGFYARTGGLNENEWIDNIQIVALKSTAPLRLSTEPADVLVLVGKTATFTVVPSDPNGATYVWAKNGTAIDGATGPSYTTPVLTDADSGSKYSVTVTGPGGTVTSRQAVATVVQPLAIANPNVSFNFDDGAIPPGTTINGTAAISVDGGVNNSGTLHLTDAAGSQGGSFIIEDPTGGQAVSGLTAHIKVHIANGSGAPADGFAFVWANDLTSDANFGESGAGSGLTIGFDTYQNPGEQAPVIRVNYAGTLVASALVPYSFVATGDAYADLYIRVKANGTLDLQYKDTMVFYNLALPGFAPTTGGFIGLGARTGGEYEEHWFDDIQIATSTGAVPPQITFTKNAAGLVLQWSGGGALQATDNLTTPNWTAVAGATSPYTVNPTSSATKFFRVQQ